MSLNNLAVSLAIAAVVLAIAAVSTGPFSSTGYTAVPMTFDVNLPFKLDAWNTNYSRWTDCTNAGMSQEQLDAFCSCKGYGRADKCWFVDTTFRYKFGGAAVAPNCIAHGTASSRGSALAKVRCTERLPDLVVSGYSVSLAHPYVNDFVTIIASIKNIGDVAPTTGFYVDASPTGSKYISAEQARGLISGSGMPVRFEYVQLTSTNNSYSLRVDSLNNIQEMREDNNINEITIPALASILTKQNILEMLHNCYIMPYIENFTTQYNSCTDFCTSAKPGSTCISMHRHYITSEMMHDNIVPCDTHVRGSNEKVSCVCCYP